MSLAILGAICKMDTFDHLLILFFGGIAVGMVWLLIMAIRDYIKYSEENRRLKERWRSITKEFYGIDIEENQ